jgi:hypothetical protein
MSSLHILLCMYYVEARLSKNMKYSTVPVQKFIMALIQIQEEKEKRTFSFHLLSIQSLTYFY